MISAFFDSVTTYWTHYLTVHLILGFIGLWIKLINTRYIRVSNICWALLFGMIYMLIQMSDLNAIVIDIRKKG